MSMGQSASKDCCYLEFPDGTAMTHKGNVTVAEVQVEFPGYLVESSRKSGTRTASLPTNKVLHTGHSYSLKLANSTSAGASEWNDGPFVERPDKRMTDEKSPTVNEELSVAFSRGEVMKDLAFGSTTPSSGSDSEDSYTGSAQSSDASSPDRWSGNIFLKSDHKHHEGKANSACKGEQAGRDEVQDLKVDEAAYEVQEGRDKFPELESEKDMEFLRQQLQMYQVQGPTGLDMRMSFKWRPKLPAILEVYGVRPAYVKPAEDDYKATFHRLSKSVPGRRRMVEVFA